MSTFRPLTRLLPLTQKRTLARMSIIGRLAAQPEVMTTATGRDLVRYGLGVTTGTRDNPETSFFNVTSFPSSEGQKNFMASLQKGQQLFVEADGKMRTIEVEGQRRRQLDLVQRE